MFCRKCGKQIKDDSNFCPYCGEALKASDPVEEYIPHEAVAEQGGGGYLFFGLCFPIIGFILSLIWNKTARARAKKTRIGAIIGAVIGVALISLVM